MNHDWIKNNIIRFIDNDLNESDKLLFIDHLSKCDFCEKDYLYVKSLWQTETDRIEVPAHLWNRISMTLNGNIAEHLPFVNSIFGFSKKYGMVFLLFLSIFLGTYFGNQILSPTNKAADKVNITEEYYPSDANVIETNIIGSGR
jgi:hypothetical protein